MNRTLRLLCLLFVLAVPGSEVVAHGADPGDLARKIASYESGESSAPPAALFEKRLQSGQGYSLNTSNKNKLAYYLPMLGPLLKGRTEQDLHEVDADPITVIVQKASQFAGNAHSPLVLVDDTSLDVQGANVGTNIRWWVEAGHLDKLEGKRATWISRLAYRVGDEFRVYSGAVRGTLVRRKEDLRANRFQPYFVPDGNGGLTLEERMPPRVNAAWKAVRAFLEDQGRSYPAITQWSGRWQNEDDAASCVSGHLRVP